MIVVQGEGEIRDKMEIRDKDELIKGRSRKYDWKRGGEERRGENIIGR